LPRRLEKNDGTKVIEPTAVESSPGDSGSTETAKPTAATERFRATLVSVAMALLAWASGSHRILQG